MERESEIYIERLGERVSVEKIDKYTNQQIGGNNRWTGIKDNVEEKIKWEGSRLSDSKKRAERRCKMKKEGKKLNWEAINKRRGIMKVVT